VSGERRRVTGPQVEIDLDPGLDDTRCVACGKVVALCECPPHVKDAAMVQAEGEGLRRRVHDALARVRAIPGWEGLHAAAVAVGAGPRWLAWYAGRAAAAELRRLRGKR
jgi:hypothetical protein